MPSIFVSLSFSPERRGVSHGLVTFRSSELALGNESGFLTTMKKIDSVRVRSAAGAKYLSTSVYKRKVNSSSL